MWVQRKITLPAMRRGMHLITERVVDAVPELERCEVGWLLLFLQHTSASLTINENADSDVRRDLDRALAAIAPEDFPYQHTIEGPDDMPAHVKTSLLGANLMIPVSDGRLALGTWQGIYLGEHRNAGGPRHLVLTLNGQFREDA